MREIVICRAAKLRKTAYALLKLASDIEADSLVGVPNEDEICRPSPVGNPWSEREAVATVAKALDHYRTRRLRTKFLPAELFGEPAWDILLDLYAARLQRRRTRVKSACIAAAVPATTALRWLGVLEEMGLVEREDSQTDARVTWVRLTDPGEAAMSGCLMAMIDTEDRAEASNFHLNVTGLVA